jgi:hypothetical protein
MSERIEEAAQMAALGLDPFKYLHSEDITERTMLIELHNRVRDIREKMDENLAVEIANNVGKLFKK